MRIKCDICGIIVDYQRTSLGQIVWGNPAIMPQVLNKCPEIMKKGPQTGQAEYWVCPPLFDQVSRVLRR